MKYNEKEVAQWSVNDMLAYLSDQHLARFNVDYQPFGTWASERGQLGNWIGTKRKAGKYGAEFTKRFIDVCLAEYRPTRDYPGINFGFMVAYMKRNIQTVQLEMMRAESAAQSQAGEVDEDWL
ncbi:hypothetical protein KYJ26_16970 [Bacillus sp. MCCB 382]|nr:hypothetical protein [Bacillus sp. MCCB 382]